MKSSTLVAVALVCAGCLHTREVDPGNAGPLVEQQRPTAQPPTAKAPARPTSSPAARPSVEAGRPELSVSPQGLMLPEGPLLIQQALATLGYLSADQLTGELDKATSAALRNFQTDKDVAKTGAPDRETVRKLGLSVEKVFRSSRVGRAHTELNR